MIVISWFDFMDLSYSTHFAQCVLSAFLCTLGVHSPHTLHIHGFMHSIGLLVYKFATVTIYWGYPANHKITNSHKQKHMHKHTVYVGIYRTTAQRGKQEKQPLSSLPLKLILYTCTLDDTDDLLYPHTTHSRVYIARK